MIPIFTVLVCYAVDFGFFFLVATSLNSAARNAMEYSIQGTSSPAQAAEPAATVVSNLAIASTGLSGASTANVSVQVCSSAVGVNASNNTTQCTTPSTGAGAVTGTPDIDPESPTFQLNRVDVLYTFTPPLPIPASIFPTTDLPSHGGNEGHAMTRLSRLRKYSGVANMDRQRSRWWSRSR